MPTRRACAVLLATGMGLAIHAPAIRAAAQPETLTVEQCAERARRQGPSVRAARLDEGAAAADLEVARRNRRPEFGLDAGLWVAPDGSYDPAFTNLGEYHAQLGMGLPLADGGKRARDRERADIAAHGARARREAESRDAGEHAAELALESARLDEVGALLASHESALGDVAVLVRAGVRAGSRSPADSIRLALAEGDLALDRASHDERVRTARLELLESLGMPLDAALVVRPAPDPDTASTGTADSLALAASAARRPELALARAGEAAARLAALDADRANAATIGLTVDAGLAGTDLTRWVPSALLAEKPDATFADRLHRDLGASAAIQFHLPLLDAARRPSVEARVLDLRASEERRRAAEVAGERELRALLERARSSARRVAIAYGVVTRAESHFLRTKSLYAAGATTLFDLLDALELHQAALERRAEIREDDRMIRFTIQDRR